MKFSAKCAEFDRKQKSWWQGKFFVYFCFTFFLIYRWIAMASSIVYDVNEATYQNQEVTAKMDFEDEWSNLYGTK